MPKLESVEVVLVQFVQLIDISLHSLTMLNTTNKIFSSIELLFTDQNSKQLEI